jgi:hypothetical protein
MNSADPENLKRIYEQWSTERLVRALGQSDEYNAAAIPVMMRVLNERGVFGVRLESVASEIHAAEEERVIRIRGWLLAFVFFMGVNALLFAILGLATAVFFTANRAWVVGLPFFFLGVYGLYGAFLLVKRLPQARKHAQLWLVLLGVLCIPLSGIALLTGGSPLVLGLYVLFAFGWHSYLSQSKRVALTYESAAGSLLEPEPSREHP